MSTAKKLTWAAFAFAVIVILASGHPARSEGYSVIWWVFLTVTLTATAALVHALKQEGFLGFLETSIMSGSAVGALNYLPLQDTWMLWGLTVSNAGLFVISLTDGSGARMKDGPKERRTNAEQYANPAVRARFTFADVVGMDDLKAKLHKAGSEIVAFMDLNRKKREKAETPRNGILLSGDPGNGKTFFAEALAGELRLPIITATFGEVVSMWIGETTMNVMKVFDDAEAQAPCVLFLDEIDSVLGSREGAHHAGAEGPKTTNAILTRLVDIRNKGVLLIAATNFIDKLDRAAIREGRFDYKIEVPPPDMPARRSILEKAIKGKLPGIAIENAVLDRAAKRWEGFSVARIQAIAKEVVEMAKVAKTPVTSIEFGMLMEALRTVQGTRGTRLSENAPTLDQLVMDGQMAATLKSIAHRMVNIESVEEMGGSVPGGILFYGPPGTGKTYTAQALAKTTGWAFLATSGQDLLSEPDRIDKILSTAKDIRPCIVMIDEADDVLANRTTAPWSKSVTNKLLAAIDGAGGRAPDIVFVAATNHPDAMDDAALRGGRFTEKVEFSLPDKSVVANFVRKWMDGSRAKADPNLTAEAVAEFVGEVSLANVKEIMQAAVNCMIGRHTGDHDALVSMQDIVQARKTVLGF